MTTNQPDIERIKEANSQALAMYQWLLGKKEDLQNIRMAGDAALQVAKQEMTQNKDKAKATYDRAVATADNSYQNEADLRADEVRHASSEVESANADLVEYEATVRQELGIVMNYSEVAGVGKPRNGGGSVRL